MNFVLHFLLWKLNLYYNVCSIVSLYFNRSKDFIMQIVSVGATMGHYAMDKTVAEVSMKHILQLLSSEVSIVVA